MPALIFAARAPVSSAATLLHNGVELAPAFPPGMGARTRGPPSGRIIVDSLRASHPLALGSVMTPSPIFVRDL